jgi:hypothetical protein
MPILSTMPSPGEESVSGFGGLASSTLKKNRGKNSVAAAIGLCQMALLAGSIHFRNG